LAEHTPETKAKITAVQLLKNSTPDNILIAFAEPLTFRDLRMMALALISASPDDGEDWRTVRDELDHALQADATGEGLNLDEMLPALAITERHVNKEGGGSNSAGDQRPKQSPKPQSGPDNAKPAPDMTGERAPVEPIPVSLPFDRLPTTATDNGRVPRLVVSAPLAGLETTAEERQGAWLLCEEVLAREENQQFPDFATVTLHATRINALFRDVDRLTAALAEATSPAERQRQYMRGYNAANKDKLTYIGELEAALAEAKAEAARQRSWEGAAKEYEEQARFARAEAARAWADAREACITVVDDYGRQIFPDQMGDTITKLVAAIRSHTEKSQP
jgi:hypothetical protein